MGRFKQKFSQIELWQRDLVVLWFGCFMTGIGASLIAPFLPLYIDSLGHFSRQQLNFQSGLIFASTYVMTAIASPLWGKLADLKGRRPMLLRASFGMAITIFLMGFVTTTWELLVLRLLLGAFAGFTSNSIALMAIVTPKKNAGSVLGTLSTSTVAGTLLGPLFGGVIVARTGYRMSFWLTGMIMALVFLLTLIFVKEQFVPPVATETGQPRSVWATIPVPRIIIGMLLTTMILQMTDKAISPILSLYVRELVRTSAQVTIFSGIVASAPGLVMIFCAPFFGRLGDRVGQYKILCFGLVLSLIWYLLLGLTHNIWQVIFLRLLVGISDAALAPSVQIILSKNTPSQVTGRIFSYNQTMQSVGAIAGPLIGTTISAYIDYRYIFFVAAFFIACNLINYATNYPSLKQESR